MERVNQFKKNKLNVILPRDPLYVDKAKFVKNCCFPVGHDTYRRLADTKYYENSPDKVYRWMKHLKDDRNIIFAVAGRFDKNN